MIELGVITVLSLLLIWKEHNSRIERKKFINALMSKNAQELRDLDIADKTEIKVEAPKEPDLVPLDSLPDDEWDKLVKEKESGRPTA